MRMVLVLSSLLLALAGCSGRSLNTESDSDATAADSPATFENDSNATAAESPAISVELARGIPYAVAVDGANLYFTNMRGGMAVGPPPRFLVVKVPLDGSPPVSLASGWAAWGIAVDSSSVYYTTGFDVMKVSIEGGTPITLSSSDTATSSDSAHQIAIDANNAYWTDIGGGKLRKVSLAGNGAPTITLAVDLELPTGIALNGTSVYWTNAGYEPTSGTVMKIPHDGGTATTLATRLKKPGGIVVDGAYAYWLNTGDGTVMKVPLDGGATVTLASGQATPYSIAVDAAYVYWTNMNGTVMKVPTGGGRPIMLARPAPSDAAADPTTRNVAFGIAVDATSVYWASDVRQDAMCITGSVMKLSPK